MTKLVCEICGLRKPKHICARCHRFVCDECYRIESATCVDCYEIRKAEEKDYLNRIERYRKICREISNRINDENCLNCDLLREILLTSLGGLKKLRSVLKNEGYLRTEIKANEVYKELENIAVKYISSLILKLKKEE